MTRKQFTSNHTDLAISESLASNLIVPAGTSKTLTPIMDMHDKKDIFIFVNCNQVYSMLLYYYDPLTNFMGADSTDAAIYIFSNKNATTVNRADGKQVTLGVNMKGFKPKFYFPNSQATDATLTASLIARPV